LSMKLNSSRPFRPGRPWPSWAPDRPQPGVQSKCVRKWYSYRSLRHCW
jgi:hypothetical protein